MGEILVVVVTVTVIIAVIIYMIYFFKRKWLEREREYLEVQQQLLREHYETLEQKIQLTRQYRQDIEKHMQILEQITGGHQTEDSRQYQKSLVEDIEGLEMEEYCTNPVVNSVFHHKIEECKSNRIRTEIRVEKLDCGRIRDVEMVGILYNLFDNAIEACQHIEKASDRYLKVECKNTGNEMELLFENTKNPNMILKAGRKTWKRKQADHGIGLEVLQELVRKNEGKMVREEEKDRYRVSIRIKTNVGE